MVENYPRVSCESPRAEVFISYSPKDHEKIKDILERLQKCYVCWLDAVDSSESSGMDSSERDGQLENCQYFIPFFSHHFFGCQRCKRDLAQFSRSFLAEEGNGSKILPVFVDDVKWEDLTDEDAASLYGVTMNGLYVRSISFPFYGKGIDGESPSDICEIIEGYLRHKEEMNEDTAHRDVFISYAHKNKATVQKIYEKLKGVVPNCWWFDNERLCHYLGFNKPIHKAPIPIIQYLIKFQPMVYRILHLISYLDNNEFHM